MKLPFPRSLVGRLSLGISGLLLISAYVPLPLPLKLVNQAIAMRAPELRLDASAAHITWGRGRVRLVDLRLHHKEDMRVRVDHLDISLDLWPGSATFGKPLRLHVVDADGELDQAIVDSFTKLRAADSSPFPLTVEVSGSSLRWTDAKMQDYLVQDVRAFGHMSPDGARFEIFGDSSVPAEGSFEAHLEAGAGLHDWKISFEAGAKLVNGWEGFHLDGVAWHGARLDLELFASGHDLDVERLVVDGSAALAELTASEPRLALRNTEARFNGDLVNGVLFKVDGVEAHSPFELELFAALDEQRKPSVRLSGGGKNTEVDAETLIWLTELLPNVGEIVTALEPRGNPLTAFECTWSEAAGFAWNLHVDPAGANITYRGLVDDDGNRFSFPYPAMGSSGSVVACSDAVLFYGAATIGDSGTADATGILDFREPGFMAIDIHIEDVPIDARISHAMTGNPAIANVWRDLGTPNQGTAEADVEIRFENERFDIRVAGNASGLSVAPAPVPVQAEIDYAWFDWVPGYARFGASMNALGGGVWIDGNMRDVTNRELPDIRLTLRGRGFDATQSELRILEAYLPLPQGLSQFDLSGEVFYDLMVIHPMDGSPTHISGQLLCEGANLKWPALGLEFEQLYAQAGFAGHGEDMQIGVARSWSQVDGGTLNGSLNMSSVSQRSEAVGAGRDLNLHNELLAKMQDLTGQQPWGRHLDWSGSVDMVAMVDPFEPQVIDSHVDFHPLRVGIPSSEEDVGFELEGRLSVRGERSEQGLRFPLFAANTLIFTGQNVDIAVRDLNAHFDDDGLQMEAVCSSSAGVSLSSHLPLLVDARTMEALNQIGLGGMLRPNDLSISASLPYVGAMHVDASGSLVMDDVSLTGGAGPLTGGHAEIEVLDAHWGGPQNFAANLNLHHGVAKVAGLALRNTTASVNLTPASIIWTNLEAETLGGRLHTNGTDPDGLAVQGSLRLDFDPSAPVSANIFVTGLQLERMRDELGLGGPLAGRVDGHIDVALPSPSPTFAKGKGWFHINGGALGTVPVLKSIFRFAGISPPIFDEGDIAFRMNGNGRVHIDEFSLQHPLLRVTGKGSMDMDTSLRLKVTLRTFGFIGRLPLLKDLIDLLIEQQVYGPAEAPIITHRAGIKLTDPNFSRPPFPLWVPAGPQPNWRISPIFPVE